MKKYFYLIILITCFNCSTNPWQELFNGENLEGWHPYLGDVNYNGWYVDQGVMVFDPELRTEAKNSSLLTDKQYESFELSLEWMISEQGNSGVFWGVQEDEQYAHAYETGPEIQILDDGWTEYVTERGDKTRAGSMFNLIAPNAIVSKPSGKWNTYVLHINHNTNQGFLIFNETKVMEFPVHGSKWDEMVAESNFATWPGFGKAKEGHIALQDHGSKVAFRNIKIKELRN